MLIITRKPGERIVVGKGDERVTITTVANRNHHSARLRAEGLCMKTVEITLLIGHEWEFSRGITLHLHDVARGQLKIGIDAPRDCPVDREEVYLSKHGGS